MPRADEIMSLIVEYSVYVFFAFTPLAMPVVQVLNQLP